MKTYCFEDMAPGRSFALGPMEFTAESIIDFAGQFDPAPFHLEEAAGKASMLGGLAASGWHVCAASMRMICDAFLLDSSCMGSPGVSECRWLAPVLAGDTLSGTVSVESARPSASRPGIGLVTIRCELHNQHGRNVLSYLNTCLMQMREAA